MTLDEALEWSTYNYVDPESPEGLLAAEVVRLRKREAELMAALLPFARYERVRIDPVIKTGGRSTIPKEGRILGVAAQIDDQYTEAEITVEDMTLARKLTGV